jgi:hypothetical protein
MTIAYSTPIPSNRVKPKLIQKYFLEWEAVPLRMIVRPARQDTAEHKQSSCKMTVSNAAEWFDGCRIEIVQVDPDTFELTRTVRELRWNGSVFGNEDESRRDNLEVVHANQSVASRMTWDLRDGSAALVNDGFYRVVADCDFNKRTMRISGISGDGARRTIEEIGLSGRLVSQPFMLLHAKTNDERAEEELHRAVNRRDQSDDQGYLQHLEKAFSYNKNSKYISCWLLRLYEELGELEKVKSMREHCAERKLDCN